jgi:hypothetical protein
MINAVGVVGWGVGGIEAEAAMLGQPVYFLTPDVVGVELSGRLREGVTATDLVLTVTELLRREKVVGTFVEYFGEGASTLSVTDRATLANMAPEYGATMGFFPVDEKTVSYMRSHRPQRSRLRALRGLFPCPGPVRHAACRPDRLLAQRAPRSVDHRALAGRPEAAAGPHRAARDGEPLQCLVQRARSGGWLCRPAASAGQRYPTERMGSISATATC